MDNILQILPRHGLSIWVRYGFTLAIVAAFFLIRAGLEGRVGVYGFFIMVPAIFLPSILFDRGSSFFATAISVLLLYRFVGGGFDQQTFNEHLIPFGLFIVVCLGIATLGEALRKALERAVEAEAAKDLLLREMGHRIKNNLQTVASLLQMQARAQDDQKTRANLESAVNRIFVVANSHDFLRSETHEHVVDMGNYLAELGERLAGMLRGDRPIAVRLDTTVDLVRTERAVLVGLIVNELVTNAFKYAFVEDESGAIDVQFHKSADGFELIVADDGKASAEAPKEGFGTRLVRLMVQQLGGSIAWHKERVGLRVVVKMPEA